MKTKFFTFAAAIMFTLLAVNSSKAQGLVIPPANKPVAVSIAVAPNPASSFVNIQTILPKNVTGTMYLTMIDAQGSVVFSKAVSECAGIQTTYIDLNAIASGLYFARVQFGAASATTKLLISK